MSSGIDLLIAGAGPVGCVIAERAAAQLGWNVLIVEKRDHIAGNCHDRLHDSGVRIHPYGPHYFRTDDSGVYEYLSGFTSWIPGNYRVLSEVGGRLLPFPINLTTLESFFDRRIAPDEAAAFLTGLQEKLAGPARNSEELILSRVGRRLYEAFYLNYTRKQWGVSPRELDPSVCGRIPVRLTREDHYVDGKHRVMPADGYTAMFSKMISRPNIRVEVGTDFLKVRDRIRPSKATVYSGPVDAYFDFRLGKLPWRSLEFDFRTFDQELVQPCAQINYPNEHDYTRSVEIKHVTGQRHAKTVVSYEYPRGEGDPYYPIPSTAGRDLYQRYRELAERETRENRVYFCGRLATYAYINTDQAVRSALDMFERIRKEAAPGS